MRVSRLFGPALLLAAFQLQAAPADVDVRLQRVERMLDSGTLMDLVTRLDSQQRELQQMRGELEELRHELQMLQQRQRDLYLDTDRRLSRFEREGARPVLDVPETPAVSDAVPSDAQPATASTTDSNDAAAPVAPIDPAAEREAYQAAFNILRELRYEQAIAAFTGFLTQYPDGRYAPTAQYWIGEANYARRDFGQAIQAYQTLVEQYPSNAKVAESLLKIGYSYHELGKADEARPVLEQLLGKYPGTTEAGQAENLLKRLRQGG